MKNSFIVFFLLLTFSLTGQQELGTHLMRGVWQASYSNPALVPDAKIVVGLPGLYQNLGLTGITYNEVVVEENGSRYIDLNRAVDALDEDNFIRENFTFETLSLGLRFGRLTLSAGHRLHFNAYANYPKTLIQLIAQGNAQFIGQTVDIGHDYQLGGYNELYLGAAVEVGFGLTVGGRFKLLNGFADISTDRNDLTLFTSDEAYELTLNADYRINTTGSLDYDGFRDITFNYDFTDFEAGDLFSINSGYAFDFGARYEIGPLDIAVSILDLGKINWEEESANYSLAGAFEYQGLDIARQVLEDSTDFGSAIDTLAEKYEFVETNNTYETDLGPRFYLSGTYQLTPRLRLGGVFYTESYRNESFTAVALAANAQVSRLLAVGGLYAIRNNRFDNLGLNAAFTLGPAQLMFATDNLLTVFRPLDSNSMNFRLGINLVFGQERE